MQNDVVISVENFIKAYYFYDSFQGHYNHEFYVLHDTMVEAFYLKRSFGDTLWCWVWG